MMSTMETPILLTSMRRLNALLRGVLVLVLAGLASSVTAGPVLDRITERGELRVCVWPDYYSISYRDPRSGEWSGIDAELSAEFAKDLGVRLVRIDSSFPKFVDDLRQQRCDVAMFAVGITPERAKLVAFSRPYLRSGIYGITTLTNRRVRDWADIDKAGVVVAVQKGTFMEPVMRATLARATMVVVEPPRTREQELEAGRVDVFMTDYPYSRRLLERVDWARLVKPPEPFSPIDYAYAVTPDDPAWLLRVDAFVSRIRQDGRLAAAAGRAGLAEILVGRSR